MNDGFHGQHFDASVVFGENEGAVYGNIVVQIRLLYFYPSIAIWLLNFNKVLAYITNFFANVEKGYEQKTKSHNILSIPKPFEKT